MGFYDDIIDENPTFSVGDAIDIALSEYEYSFEGYWGLDAESPPDDLSLDDWIKVIELAESARRLAADAIRFVRPAGVPPAEWSLPSVLRKEADRLDASIEDLLAEIRSRLSESEWEHLKAYCEPSAVSDPRIQLAVFDNAFELAAAVHFYRDTTTVARRLKDVLKHAIRHKGLKSMRYLERVTECYVRGMVPEFAVMCRATLAAALEERITASQVLSEVGTGKAGHLGLSRWIDYCRAKSIYDQEGGSAASLVKAAGDKAAHGELETLPDADLVLEKLAISLEPLQKLPIGVTD